MGFVDDFVYGVLLVISLLVGHFVKRYEPEQKKYASSGIGFLMVLFVCRFDVLHSLIVACMNAIIVLYVHPR